MQRKSIEEARRLQKEGEQVVNDRFGRSPHEPKYVWKAKYIIHWRPEYVMGVESTEWASVEEL